MLAHQFSASFLHEGVCIIMGILRRVGLTCTPLPTPSDSLSGKTLHSSMLLSLATYCLPVSAMIRDRAE